MTPVMFTREDFDLVIQALAISAIFGGFAAVMLFCDLLGWIERLRWYRRRRQRLARRRAKAVTHA